MAYVKAVGYAVVTYWLQGIFYRLAGWQAGKADELLMYIISAVILVVAFVVERLKEEDSSWVEIGEEPLSQEELQHLVDQYKQHQEMVEHYKEDKKHSDK